ncbi:RNase H1/viroplasmin domain-containing protein [Clostridium perfringens]|uniref:RNase H1/viroplasmin domain-containing protein n=2 Tax=Clostridium perfringens TaxID=1502 RepID=UPI001CCDE705|nr:RNase H1/viroplasmin domain-containing protein [Clostridium perfringens]MCC2766261.1 RNase H1/viroplasmin domain-containing protein [Clostridium perfringens]MCG4546502.1 RNase H1/viroplasmin domain-containing protein [Clostridium perfringens]MCG4554908.1 RNase H1/viroplasmin domain-containing protein [Clostridium perfringens]MCX0386961.1 RNase H1/viroplasmin domain-containing protein [Clostridium perfringens]MDM0569969.1 RNase H1/viroplasmin domain-containing protein [Clostridium perfringen
MAKKNNKKYYAIKVGNGVKNKIVTTWKECSELVLGFNSVYKSFKTREEAEQYLNGIKDSSIDIVLEKNKKAREYNTKKKKSTRSLQGIRIDKDLYDRFKEKCNEFEFTEEKAITLLIEEWLS